MVAMAAILDFWLEQVTFDVQVTPMLRTKFQVSWNRSRSKKRKKSDFQDDGHGGHLGFPIGTILPIFEIRQPHASCQVSSQLAFLFRRKKRKIDFQDGGRFFCSFCFSLDQTPSEKGKTPKGKNLLQAREYF